MIISLHGIIDSKKTATSGTPFIFTIDTSLGTGDTYDIPVNVALTYNFDLYW